MARKSIGYVHMEWTCPNCSTRNKGTDQMCVNCGTAQPKDVEFEQVPQETLIEDESVIAKAKAGADIHCPFCGTRNPATAVKCNNCFGDLSEGVRRQSGQKVGDHRSAPVPDIICDYCQTANPGTATQCSNCTRPLAKLEPKTRSAPKLQPQPQQTRKPSSIFLYVFLTLVIGLCGYLFFLSNQRSEVTGTVRDVGWERTIQVEGLVPVQYENWIDRIPADGEVGICRDEVRQTSPEPMPNSQEVCGEPYTVDTGTGVGELVQDCEYLVFDDFCSYSVDEWQIVRQQRESGSDFSPIWPVTSLDVSEREGEYEEEFRVVFNSDGRSYTYSPRSESEYYEFDVGSDWILEINGLNNVVSVERR